MQVIATHLQLYCAVEQLIFSFPQGPGYESMRLDGVLLFTLAKSDLL